MSKRFSQEQLQSFACTGDSPLSLGAGRKPGLPRGFFGVMAGLYLAVIGGTAALFLDAALAAAIMTLAGFVVFVFALAGRWAKARPDYDTAAVTGGSPRHAVSLL
ncbi:hypothetical protein [Novosphingobium beihaiensis]|uniref:Uncharacterized protein n=1 Tax=Novosphingobium beihaiensis TaxID=2930389 RepID=A0ABT0BS91_9SPHN|nr:hypothetical protein [Novosphingobium beihaiensis]MCJ2187743.1 hypothetical protein [Novosphingobium beihaiensis]